MNDPPAQKPKPLDWRKKKKAGGDIAAMTVMMSLCQNCAASEEREAETLWAGVKSSVLSSGDVVIFLLIVWDF